MTVTQPDIIRYFMTIPEACRLVLEAGTMGKGGEIFIFDMGEPVKIADLAKRMIEAEHSLTWAMLPGEDSSVSVEMVCMESIMTISGRVFFMWT